MKKFTLIELMISIAVIGILASMLMPSLHKTREKGFSTVCINNLKQMQYACTIYVDDNDGLLARNYAGGVIGKGNTEQKIMNTSLIFPYLKTTKPYKCPSDPVPASVERNHAVKSYGYNAYLNDNKSWSVDKLSMVSASHNNVMGFIDEAGNVANGFVRPNADWIGGWHNESYNISFLDGHVNNVKLISDQSWIVVQNMIDSGSRNFSSIGGSNPDRLRLLEFMAID